MLSPFALLYSSFRGREKWFLSSSRERTPRTTQTARLGICTQHPAWTELAPSSLQSCFHQWKSFQLALLNFRWSFQLALLSFHVQLQMSFHFLQKTTCDSG